MLRDGDGSSYREWEGAPGTLWASGLGVSEGAAHTLTLPSVY